MPWNMLGVALTNEIRQLPEYKEAARWPCFQEITLSDAAAKITEEKFQMAFIWTAGSWSLSLSGIINGKPFSIPWIVDLTSSEVEAMKSVAHLYKQGVAVTTSTMLTGDVPPFVEKPNREAASSRLGPGD